VKWPFLLVLAATSAHKCLKNMAATVDGDFTDMTGNNDGLSQVEEAA